MLLDFRSAFPSITHDYMWDVLDAIGMPSAMIKCLQLFYRANAHFIKAGKGYFRSFSAANGVRQGCPLSGILFVLCVDLLLRRTSHLLRGDSVVRGYADDTALVIEDYVKELPMLCQTFEQFRAISGLELNVEKTFFIPLWRYSSEGNVRLLLRESCPLWGHFLIRGCGKYLGFYVGPTAGNNSWEKALRKYEQRTLQWAANHLGLYFSIFTYKVYIQPVLSFVAQLCEPPPDLLKRYQTALRQLVPGPGNFITHADLSHLSCCGMRSEFPDPFVLCKAAKLRVSQYAVSQAQDMHRELSKLQSEFWLRPFGIWHYSSFASILTRNVEDLCRCGISCSNILYELRSLHRQREGVRSRFQSYCAQLIREKAMRRYDPVQRMRHKLARWNLDDVPRTMAERAVTNLMRLSKLVPQRVVANALRTLFNGWATHRRMASLCGCQRSACVLGCGSGEDSIEHYSRCGVFKQHVADTRPNRVDSGFMTLAQFLLVARGLDDDTLRFNAVSSYALANTVRSARRSCGPEDVDVRYLLRWFSKRAMSGANVSKSAMTLDRSSMAYLFASGSLVQ